MFSAGRLSGRRRRGPRGAGACWGHERVGTSAGRESGPRSRPRPAVPGGCARPCRRVGSCGGGCPAPTGRSHVCGGAPSCVGSSAGPGKRRSPSSALSGLRGALGPPRRPLRPRFLSFARRRRQRDPRRAGAPSPERCSELGRPRSVGVFHQPGRVKFENKMQARKLRRQFQQLLPRGGSIAFQMFWVV